MRIGASCTKLIFKSGRAHRGVGGTRRKENQTMKHETLLEKLGRLSQVRTVRTDQLHAAVKALCEKLDEVALDGDNISIGEYTLRSVEKRSNVGALQFWEFSYGSDDRYSCFLERRVGSDGYLHGDFHCPMRGPTRGELIEFAANAERLVQGLVNNAENSAERLEKAMAAVQQITASL